MSLFEKVVDLIKFYWSKRSKPYVRVSLAVIAIGGSVLAAPAAIVIFRALTDQLAQPSSGSPWWSDPVVGLSLIVLGVFIFVIFYLPDPDRRKPLHPPPSVTITPGENWTFEQTALAIGQAGKMPVLLENFSTEERETVVYQQQVRGSTLEEALRNLQAIIPRDAIRAYDVCAGNNLVTVRRR